VNEDEITPTVNERQSTSL